MPLLQHLARSLGADLRGGCVVSGVRSDDHGVELDVDGWDRPVRAGAVVLALDAWSNDLLTGLGANLPLTVLQEQVTYYDAADPGPFGIGRLPLWIWMDDPGYYGFPIFGRPGVKIAQDCGGREVTATERSFEPDPRILARTDALGGIALHPTPRSGPGDDHVPLHAHP